MAEVARIIAALRERVERLEKALRQLAYSDGHFKGGCSSERCHPECVAARAALATPTPEPTTPPQQEPLSPVAGQTDLDWLAQAIQKAALDSDRYELGVDGLFSRAQFARGVRQLLHHQDQQSRQAERQRVLGVLDAVERPTRRCAQCRIHREADVLREVRHRLSQPRQGGG